VRLRKQIEVLEAKIVLDSSQVSSDAIAILPEINEHELQLDVVKSMERVLRCQEEIDVILPTELKL